MTCAPPHPSWPPHPGPPRPGAVVPEQSLGAHWVQDGPFYRRADRLRAGQSWRSGFLAPRPAPGLLKKVVSARAGPAGPVRSSAGWVLCGSSFPPPPPAAFQEGSRKPVECPQGPSGSPLPGGHGPSGWGALGRGCLALVAFPQHPPGPGSLWTIPLTPTEGRGGLRVWLPSPHLGHGRPGPGDWTWALSQLRPASWSGVPRALRAL